MDCQAALYGIARRLLVDENPDGLADEILRAVAESTGAERGFLVLQSEGDFVEKAHIQHESGRVSGEARRFSRSLVREAIRGGALIDVPDVSTDYRFAGKESIQLIGRASALVAPLRYRDAVYGVIYLERSAGPGAFGHDARAFLEELAQMAAVAVHRALETRALRKRAEQVASEMRAVGEFPGLIARDPAMLRVLRMVVQIADAPAPVLIHGETGTGKELIARALHLNSARRQGPFAVVHCGAIPEAVIESELFGHARGAFTGAERDRPGRLASAHGGSLFLDEIGDVPLAVQAKLLRFVQLGEIQRVGTDLPLAVKVRVIAATHHDLAKLVREGRFREDLLYRLNVLDIAVPPLRERRADVPLLVESFTARYCRTPERPPRWSGAALAALEAHPFPGNVRELEHLVQRACLFAPGDTIERDLLPAELHLPTSPSASPEFSSYTNEELKRAREAAVGEIERRFLHGLMRRCADNVSQAARRAGMQRSYLQKLLARHRDIRRSEET
ncbi:MAG: sigma-54-dependent Fis family transcriptional regulator [Candidatus Schekmanbacteria bacterium]|nr:sigma-54-dependent Fis family transcriptional regulator [Candidatus Schekmanbacteria bacterium]